MCHTHSLPLSHTHLHTLFLSPTHTYTLCHAFIRGYHSYKRVCTGFNPVCEVSTPIPGSCLCGVGHDWIDECLSQVIKCHMLFDWMTCDWVSQSSWHKVRDTRHLVPSHQVSHVVWLNDLSLSVTKFVKFRMSTWLWRSHVTMGDCDCWHSSCTQLVLLRGCVWVCMYVNMCTCIHVYLYIYTCMCAYMSLYIYVCIYIYMYTYVYIYIYIKIHICIYMHIHVNTYVYIYIYICLYIYTCIQACVYINICASIYTHS